MTTFHTQLPQWTEGVCGDGAAILRDGVMVPIEEVIARLNQLEARAALSAPEPGPTEAEVADIAEDLEYRRLPRDTSTGPSFLLEFACAALTRWGRPAVEPVPVSERPWERDGWCDKEGMCWMGDGEGCGFVSGWRLCRPSDSCLAWSLPHWAIPVPQEGADG